MNNSLAGANPLSLLIHSPDKCRQMIPKHSGTMFAKSQRRDERHTLKVQPEPDSERRYEKQMKRRPGNR